MSFLHMHKGVPCGNRACALEPDSLEAMQAVEAGLSYDAVTRCPGYGDRDHSGHIWRLADPSRLDAPAYPPEGARWCPGRRVEAEARLTELAQKATTLIGSDDLPRFDPGKTTAWDPVEAERAWRERRAAERGEEAARLREAWREQGPIAGAPSPECEVCGLTGAHEHGAHRWNNSNLARELWRCMYCKEEVRQASDPNAAKSVCPAVLRNWPRKAE